MGLEAFSYNILEHTAKKYPTPKVLSLGIPEIFAPAGHLPEEFKVTDEPTILRHGGQQPYDGVKVLREHLKLDIKFLEFKDGEHIDIVGDMNYEGTLAKDTYDIVIDPGTFEHIFNVAYAFKACWQSLKVGGRILHSTPVNRINHGLYSISPTAFKDYYEANGGEIEEMVLWGGKYAEPQILDIEENPYERFRLKGEASVCILAHKLKDTYNTWPIQWKYRQ